MVLQVRRAVAAEALACFGRGKSELRRAVCRITSGIWASRLKDGKCHREDTAAGFIARGKGEKVR